MNLKGHVGAEFSFLNNIFKMLWTIMNFEVCGCMKMLVDMIYDLVKSFYNPK